MTTEKIMPARDQAQSRNTIIDLDEVIAQKSAIKVNGKVYDLIPITIEKSMEIDTAKSRLNDFFNGISSSNPSSMNQLYNEYYNYIKLVVPDLTLEETLLMTTVQVQRFFKVVNEHINLELTGKTLAENENEKKKILKASNLE